MSDIGVHTTLSVFVEGAYAVVQPSRVPSGTKQVESLSIDLVTGSVAVVDSVRQTGTYTSALAVLGLCKLINGWALVIVTEASQVATLLGSEIFEVDKTKIIVPDSVRRAKANKHLLKLLRDGVSPFGSARSIYYSYYYDITLSSQRMAAMASDDAVVSASPAERAEDTFFWNKSMSQPLLKAGGKRFVVPAMLGFIRQLTALPFSESKTGKGVAGSLTLIARRSNQRLGTRHWRRGVDTDGNAANFVETEQILTVDSLATVASFVQIRGSIPLLWTEMPNMKYKPTRAIAASDVQGPAFAKHVALVTERYKEAVAVSLINLDGGEGKLATAFEQQATAYTKSLGAAKPTIRYVPFDFHKECGATRYHRLSILWDQISADFTRWGFFMAKGGELQESQGGVVRTNCIDCLDRTNVLQCVLARKALERILRKMGLMDSGNTLPDEYPAIEAHFKILWADHGDAVSTQYAGTGAMKSGFTRTGKRTFGGIVDDGVKAVSRFYLNNFQDGQKQDALDLVAGCYVPDHRAVKSPITRLPSPLFPVIVALAALYMGFKGIGEFRGCSSLAAHLVVNVLLPILVGAAVLFFVVKNGKHLVNRPQLCMQLADTVPKADSKKSK